MLKRKQNSPLTMALLRTVATTSLSASTLRCASHHFSFLILYAVQNLEPECDTVIYFPCVCIYSCGLPTLVIAHSAGSGAHYASVSTQRRCHRPQSFVLFCLRLAGFHHAKTDCACGLIGRTTANTQRYGFRSHPELARQWWWQRRRQISPCAERT